MKEIKVNPLQDTIRLLSRIAEAMMLTHGQRLKVRDITRHLLDESESALDEILDDPNAGEVFGNRMRYLCDMVKRLPLTECISLMVTKIDTGTSKPSRLDRLLNHQQHRYACLALRPTAGANHTTTSTCRRDVRNS